MPRERSKDRGLLRPVLIALSIQILLTVAATAAKLRAGRDDTDIYFLYATRTLGGNVPYRDFVVEYPPFALPLFLVAGLVSHEVTGFKIAFAVEMLAFNAATVWMVAAWAAGAEGMGRVRTRLAWYTALYLFLSRLMVVRYDAATMCVGFAASTWWFSGRSGRAGVASGIGTLMKVYPSVIAIVAAPWDLARGGPLRGRGLATFSATLFLGSAGWVVMGGPRGVAESLGYQLGRGFEYGSLYSGVQMLAAKAAGAEIAVVRDHAAWSSLTPWSPRLMPLVLPIQAATIVAVCVVFRRRGMSEGIRYSGAAILAFIITGKVFSPQYLIWLLPFIAVLQGPIARRCFCLFAAGCAATLIAPALTGSYPRTGMAVILAYNVKNALFLALLVILTFGPGPNEVRGKPESRLEEKNGASPTG